MLQDKDNEPAFPITEHNNYEGQLVMENRYPGLTKREWYAGMALQGFMANMADAFNPKECAEKMFEIADAMLSQSKQPI